MNSISNFSSIQILHLSAGFSSSTGKERLIKIVRELELNGIFEVKSVEPVDKVTETVGVANIEIVIPITVGMYNKLIGENGLVVAREAFNVNASFLSKEL